ncbi:MAG: universal stress protein, UspA family [Flavobacteriaceae bacterium]|jgi:nucleotide-binding universal stress UspA family protein|nr:universal stress protein, UspA family [Flavobacteriaceae bacterium]|tara:strand:- start:26284 stop:27132 length:849 start_codon:yes stop_codon:yes gene_type:complete
MKRILLPTDFSENAYNAIAYALQLYKQETCTFYLLHTYTPAMISAGSMMDSYSAITLQEAAKENADKKMDALKEKLEASFKNPKHSLKYATSFNMLISEMELIIEEKGIDLVIMGTQGATGAKEIFLGTHTMYAIKKIKVPVLAVPENFSFEEPKEILFPTDYNFDKDNKYLPMLRELCEQHVSELNMLNVYYGTALTEKQQEAKTFLDNYFIRNAHLFHEAEGTDVLGAVEQFQMKSKINLIVMIHNKHNFLENLLFKPVINQVVYHTNVPFLVIPSVERQ